MSDPRVSDHRNGPCRCTTRAIHNLHSILLLNPFGSPHVDTLAILQHVFIECHYESTIFRVGKKRNMKLLHGEGSSTDSSFLIFLERERQGYGGGSMGLDP